MMHMLEYASKKGARIVNINIRMADAENLASLKTTLLWLCSGVSRRLEVSPPVAKDWDDVFGAKDNCTAFFEDYLIPAGKGGLILSISNLDRLYDSPSIAQEFLALLRAWHEMGKSQELWRSLRLVLEYSTEMYLPMNTNHSPLNVGLPVVLSEWDLGIVRDLARRHRLDWSETEIERLMGLIGGHPHLVRIALYHAAKGASLHKIVSTGATDEGIFADHLKRLLWDLQREPALCEAAARVIAASAPVRLNSEFTFKLVSLGLVTLEGDDVRAGRELYRHYLHGRLRSSS